jgi:hypothetical protein
MVKTETVARVTGNRRVVIYRNGRKLEAVEWDSCKTCHVPAGGSCTGCADGETAHEFADKTGRKCVIAEMIQYEVRPLDLYRCSECDTVLKQEPETIETQRQIIDPPDSACPAAHDEYCEACKGLDTFDQCDIEEIIPGFRDRCRNDCSTHCVECIELAVDGWNAELDVSN